MNKSKTDKGWTFIPDLKVYRSDRIILIVFAFKIILNGIRTNVLVVELTNMRALLQCRLFCTIFTGTLQKEFNLLNPRLYGMAMYTFTLLHF